MNESSFDAFLSRARRIGVEPDDEDAETARARRFRSNEPSKLVGSYAEARNAMRQMVVIEPIGAAGHVAILSTMLQRAYERQNRIRRYSSSS